MDFLDFFENLGLGIGVVIVFVVFLFLIIFIVRLIPGLLMGIGSIIFLLAVILVICAVIYFIGKSVKVFIKK